MLQALHPALATPEILADFEVVLAFLAKAKFPAPRLIPTLDRESFVHENGRIWRLLSFVAGETLDHAPNYAQIEEAMALLGRFHDVMSLCNYAFLSRHPLHQTAQHLERLKQVFAQAPKSEKNGEVGALFRQITSRASLLPPNLPVRIVHGDPKISNFRFANDQAVALLDLDTCTRHSVLVDLGDAARSMCATAPEDEVARFDPLAFGALCKGYHRERSLTREEVALLPRVPAIIAWELAARFLTDYFEDSYFAFDAARYPSRKAHNWARAKGQAALAQSIEDQAVELRACADDAFGLSRARL